MDNFLKVNSAINTLISQADHNNYLYQRNKIDYIGNLEHFSELLTIFASFGKTIHSGTQDELTDLLSSLRRYYLRVRGHLPHKDLIASSLALKIIKFLKEFPPPYSDQFVISLVSLIHVLNSSEQEIFLQIIAQYKGEISDQFVCDLCDYLNLTDRLLHIISNNLDQNFDNRIGDDCYSVPNIEDLLALKSAKISRLLLINNRRQDPVLNNSNYPLSQTPQINDLVNQCIHDLTNSQSDDVIKKSFTTLCMISKFHIHRSASLNIYKQITKILTQINADMELIYLANAGLNHILARKIIFYYPTELVNTYNRVKYASLDQYYLDILLKRAHILTTMPILQESLAVVIATTDSPANFKLLFASILSVCLQSNIPREVYIFVDPVNQNKNFSSELRNKLQECETFVNLGFDKNVYELISRVKISVESNSHVKGQYFARNKAAELSQCKYLAIQDDDDLSDYARFEKQINQLKKYGLLCYGKHIRISESGFYQHDSRDYKFVGDGIASLLTYTTIVISHPFLELRSRADVEFRERMIQLYGNKSASYIDDIVLLMRGASTTTSTLFEINHKIAFENFYSNIKNKFFS